jgi:hypothetical protein
VAAVSCLQNLSEEVEVEAFYDFFSKFGEILQCKTDTDSYGQYFGQVQYMDTSSVAAAVDGANGTRWHGAVIQVVPHHKAAHVDRWGCQISVQHAELLAQELCKMLREMRCVRKSMEVVGWGLHTP